jgi:pimeloyl-ACP methyl ester carboxylesterase
MTSFTPQHRGGAGPPLLLVHGFTDTWRTWELVLPALERHHDVLAVTLPGHAGGPRIDGLVDETTLVAALESSMDAAGFDTVHVAGNSLGGYLALQLAMRGRARSVVALAPAGGWAEGDDSFLETLDFFIEMQDLLRYAAPRAEEILATPEGRRRATLHTSVNYEHIPVELLAHQMRGAADCAAVMPLIEHARAHGWSIEPERITCPVRFLWGDEDRLLRWPTAAARYRTEWLPAAEWVELEGVGHAPQLDVPLETSELILGLTSE